MQPSNSFIALGVGAIVTVSAVSVSPATAEPGVRQSSAEATQTDAAVPASVQQPTAGSAKPSQSADRSSASTPTDAAQTQTSISQSQIDQTQRRIENRLDRLQTESEIRQQLNQSEFKPANTPMTTGIDALQMEQQIQQQINLQDLQNQRNSGTSPSRSLDQLQFEQRVRQQLQQPQQPQQPVQPQSPAQPESQAAVPALEPAASESASQESASKPEATQPVEQSANPSQAANRSEARARGYRSRAQANLPANRLPANADAKKPSVEPAESTAASASEPQPEPTADAKKPDAENETSDQRDNDSANNAAEVETQSDEQKPDAPAASASEPSTNETPSNQAQSNPSGSTQPENQPAEEQPKRSSSEAEDRIDRQNRDYPTSNDAPAPEYLDPDPNPLSFPTQTDEVEVVGTQPLTLKQAVELAVRNNPSLRQQQFTLERDQASLREAQASNYPTLDATINLSQSEQEGISGGTPEPAVTFQPVRGANGQTTLQAVPNPRAGETTPTTRTYNNATGLGGALQLSYSVFTSGRRSALINAARGQVRFQQLELESQTEQLILDTTNDYYDLQEAGARVNIFRANLAQAEQSLRDAQALERAGVGTRFDVLQAEVDVANARQDLTSQLSQLEIARRQLAQRLNLAQTVDLAAADPIEVRGVWDLSLEETIVQAYKNRAELEQQLTQREIAQQNRRAALAQLGPQVAFNGSIGLNDSDLFPGGQGFLYNYQLALQASLVLFDGGQARAQANQAESNISIAEAGFENARDQIRFAVEQAYSQLDSNFANIQTTALAVEQATEALRLARLRFQAGVGTQTDVLRQQSALAQAQVNNLSAILDYNRAIASLQRQVSNFPEGYLNEQP